MADLKAQVIASWKGTHGGADIPPGELAYWIDKASHPEVYSDGITRIGWNRYWETRMMPGNDGAADPKLGDLPALYQPQETGMMIQETVVQVRSKYGPSPSANECGAIVNEVAWIHRNDPERWGVSTKPNGDNAILSDGSPVARDIVQNGNTLEHFDVLVSAGDGGPATPSWQPKGVLNDPSRPWKAPIDPGTTPPVPPDPPQPPANDTQKILDAIAKHDTEIKTILMQTRAAAAATLARLKGMELVGTAKILGMTVNFTLKPKV